MLGWPEITVPLMLGWTANREHAFIMATGLLALTSGILGLVVYLRSRLDGRGPAAGGQRASCSRPARDQRGGRVSVRDPDPNFDPNAHGHRRIGRHCVDPRLPVFLSKSKGWHRVDAAPWLS